MERIINFGKNTFASLKIYNYRLYFIGQTVSVSVCDAGRGTILAGLNVNSFRTTLGFSGRAIFTHLLLGPWAGLMVTDFQKKMLVFTNGTSAILAFVLGALIAGDWVKLWMVFVIASLSGIVNALIIRRGRLLPWNCRPENLTNAISLNSAQFNLARQLVQPWPEV